MICIIYLFVYANVSIIYYFLSYILYSCLLYCLLSHAYYLFFYRSPSEYKIWHSDNECNRSCESEVHHSFALDVTIYTDILFIYIYI